jgi:Tfp pilus assembly protein PilX
MRKIAMRRLIKGEKGYVLIAALLVLVVVGLISGPLLSYMVSGLKAGHVFEVGAAELYAADAGVQDAVWRIQNNIGLCEGSPTTTYNISNVNGKSVEVTVTYQAGPIYHVESTATGDGSETKIDVYIVGTSVAGDFSGITNNVITSPGEINYYGQVNVDPETGNHSPQANYGGAWPTPEELCDWYGEDVENSPHYYSDTTIDLNGVSRELGPLYVDGNLTIMNSGGPATLTLTGVIYATGDTQIGTTDKDFTLGLNGTTIFVQSATAGNHKALEIGGRCSMDGSGALIAVGDTYFAPDGNIGSEEGPVLTLSVLGSTLLQPSGNFYGTVAGNVTVDVKSGSGQNLVYPDTGFGVINFPGCTAGRYVYSIVSWEVSRQ